MNVHALPICHRPTSNGRPKVPEIVPEVEPGFDPSKLGTDCFINIDYDTTSTLTSAT